MRRTYKVTFPQIQQIIIRFAETEYNKPQKRGKTCPYRPQSYFMAQKIANTWTLQSYVGRPQTVAKRGNNI